MHDSRLYDAKHGMCLDQVALMVPMDDVRIGIKLLVENDRNLMLQTALERMQPVMPSPWHSLDGTHNNASNLPNERTPWTMMVSSSSSEPQNQRPSPITTHHDKNPKPSVVGINCDVGP